MHEIAVSTMKSVILLALLCISLADARRMQSYIAGGAKADEGQFPYIVSIQDLMDSDYCGGSLISRRHVLTAAHCIYNELKTKGRVEAVVRTGSNHVHRGVKYNVEKAIPHAAFNPTTYKNDIAILVLSKAVKLGPSVQIVPLNREELAVGNQLVAAGWGITGEGQSHSPELMFFRTKVFNKGQCKQQYSESREVIWDGNFCAYVSMEIGTCDGDGGGPLVFNNHIAGITSFSKPCNVGAPDVFTKVSKYVGWVENVVKTS